MKKTLQRLFAGAAATMFVVAVFAAEPAHTLTSASGMKLELPWSKRWTQSQDPKYSPATVGFFVEADPQAMQVMISVAGPVPDGNMSDERMLEVMKDTIASLAPQAVEQDLAAIELKGGKYHAWYVVATDKAPKPDEYKYISQVLVAAGDAFVFSTILYNESGKQDALQVREALTNVTVTLP